MVTDAEESWLFERWHFSLERVRNDPYHIYPRFQHIKEANGWFRILLTHSTRPYAVLNRRNFDCRLNCSNSHWTSGRERPLRLHRVTWGGGVLGVVGIFSSYDGHVYSFSGTHRWLRSSVWDIWGTAHARHPWCLPDLFDDGHWQVVQN